MPNFCQNIKAYHPYHNLTVDVVYILFTTHHTHFYNATNASLHNVAMSVLHD